MATQKIVRLSDSLAGNRLSEGVSAPKNKRNRSSRLDRHIVFIHQYVSDKVKSNLPQTYSLRGLADRISKKDGRTISHTTVLRFLKKIGLWEIFNE
jgi:hypothetical protein